MTRSQGRRAHDKKRYSIVQSGRRVACESCKMMHPPPGCPAEDEPEQVMLMLAPRLARLLRAKVPDGQRSALIARLLWKELG